jgi:amidophosphoribosyltransferase
MSGFFGSISKKDSVYDVYYGTDYHSHLGTRRAGMVFYSKEKGFQRAIHSIENNYFRNKFEDDVQDFEGNMGLGVISDNESQPIIITSHLGRYAVVTVAKILNIDELQESLLTNGHSFSETNQNKINPTELVALLISDKEDFVSGIENVYKNIKGSCSILILTENRIIAARDKLGRTPIIIGKREDGYAVSFETCAFSNIGYDIEKYMGPGEIISITADGYEQLKEPNKKMQICSFLWVYYGYPPSNYEGINVDDYRYRCGADMAKKDNINADFVAGIPDSGYGYAIGYSNEKHIPIKRAYAKYTPTWPRSFMPQNQEIRKIVAKMKLIPNESIIKNKIGIFFDDSIVRGTQLADNVKKLRKSGIKEVHMRISCPPLTYPCEFLNFSRSRSNFDMATYKAVRELENNEIFDMKKYSDHTTEEYKNMVEIIKRNLDLDSLEFQNINDLISTIGLPKEDICTHCFDGSSYF